MTKRKPTPITRKLPLIDGCAVHIVGGGGFRGQSGSLIERSGTAWIVRLKTGAQLRMQGTSLRRIDEGKRAA